jgi:CheY-like chemotaxis protein
MMRAKILIVDDDREILLGLENRVSWMGHEPVTANNGRDALRLIEQGDFDLVLLDLELPALSNLDSGLDIMERVKGDPHRKRDTEEEVQATYSEPFIIIMTCFGNIEPAVIAMRLGAFDFLAKPFSADHMTVVVKKALAAVALQRQVNVLRQEIDGRYDSLKTGPPPRHYHGCMAAHSRKIIEEALRREWGKPDQGSRRARPSTDLPHEAGPSERNLWQVAQRRHHIFQRGFPLNLGGFRKILPVPLGGKIA